MAQRQAPVTAADVEAAKAKAAATRLPELLDLLAANALGEPQNGEARYYAESDFDLITRITAPSSLSRCELLLRLRAFRAHKHSFAADSALPPAVATAP